MEIFFIALILSVLVAYTKRASFRGWLGEQESKTYLRLSLPQRHYQLYHNIIIPSDNGTAQIDHLVVSPYGIWIVETKNKKGWIFGSEHQSKWTQVLGDHKYSFQNPLRQVYRQKKVLAQFLKISEAEINVVIYFIGDCTFKTALPENVLKSGVGRYIKTKQAQKLTDETLNMVLQSMRHHTETSTLTTKDHIRSLRERHDSNTTCPRCGGSLILRTAKKGPSAGSTFLGCENFPRCRFTKEHPEPEVSVWQKLSQIWSR